MDLKPCPFCGGKAKQVDICATDFSSANAGGSYIICQSCLACSAVMFGEKAGLSELWNHRALPPEPRTCETCDVDLALKQELGAGCHDEWNKKRIDDRAMIIESIVKTIGGEVEGKPTNKHNYLQRIRELVNNERSAPRSPQSADVLKTPCAECSIMLKDCDHCGPPAWEGFIPLNDRLFHPQSADVEMVREALDRAIAAGRAGITDGYAMRSYGDALAAMDRIVGKEA